MEMMLRGGNKGVVKILGSIVIIVGGVCLGIALIVSFIAGTYLGEILLSIARNRFSALLAILAIVPTVVLMIWQSKRMARKEFPQDKIAIVSLFRKIAAAVVGIIFLVIATFSWIIMETIQDNLLISLPVIILISITVVWWVKKENEKDRRERQRANEVLESHGLEPLKE
jgi:uncharacterized membrane protein